MKLTFYGMPRSSAISEPLHFLKADTDENDRGYKLIWKLERLIAGVIAAIVAAAVPSVSLAEEPETVLFKEDSPFTAIEEDGVYYALGAAIDGGWLYFDFYDHVEAHRSDPHTSIEPLCTGHGLTLKNGSRMIAVVKGDIQGTGTWSISQLVGMCKAMQHPEECTTAQRLAADINEDGQITIIDLVMLCKKDVSGVAPLDLTKISYPVDEDPTVKIEVSNPVGSKYDVVIENLRAKKVWVPTWCENRNPSVWWENGKYKYQKDLVWYEAVMTAPDTWSVTIDAADHGYAEIVSCIYADGRPVGNAVYSYSGPLPSINHNSQDYTYGGSGTIGAYLYANTYGGVTRVECEQVFRQNESGVTLKIHIEDYDENFHLIHTNIIEPEFNIWGGYFTTAKYNYLITGQRNDNEDNNREVIRVTKYDKNWKEIDSAHVYGANTYIPFRAGCLRCMELDGWIYVISGHQMYQAPDGGHHQARMLFAFSEDDMRVSEFHSFGGPRICQSFL